MVKQRGFRGKTVYIRRDAQRIAVARYAFRPQHVNDNQQDIGPQPTFLVQLGNNCGRSNSFMLLFASFPENGPRLPPQPANMLRIGPSCGSG
jgi:hypothetical protein